MTCTEELTTWFVLGGIKTNTTMGEPIEAALMCRLSSMWVLGWAMRKANGADGVHIGDQWLLIRPDRCIELCESHLASWCVPILPIQLSYDISQTTSHDAGLHNLR